MEHMAQGESGTVVRGGKEASPWPRPRAARKLQEGAGIQMANASMADVLHPVTDAEILDLAYFAARQP